ncbi:unnamed protein product [Tilletia controversa]|uniref:Mtf2-like C-terminal domain-containing protein n=1 Tax=Tilletia controversa TaxID=13291 RepID=A0A8X7N1Y5_9BASI|nr:hypothetical protein CF328_g99 [Tilletia controversa]KAE8255819.1 hypothetical protein A4X06_0g232 [Tilletia controversa]CAD6902590.1 unnamed protein product [Tilletia controversa]CAD6921250.1 unnamed protein product [Tilletia controversa]CAD6944296.1 unnamed protein product [Tilletia controversa]
MKSIFPAAYTRRCLCQTAADLAPSTPWRQQQQQVRLASQLQPRSRYGRLREGTAAQASPYEVDIKMDEVKEALNACGTVQKTWDWALTNLWGVSPAAPAGPGQGQAPYGIETAFYAPALHSLFLHFRDSLRSPHAALSVLEFTRARSTESLVLGSTPALYADVVKLHWSLRRDLAGVRDTVRAAKRIGILSSSRGSAADASSSSAASSSSSSGRYERGSRTGGTNEDDVLRTQVEIALDEARREALTGGSSSSSSSSILDDDGDEDFMMGSDEYGSEADSPRSDGRRSQGRQQPRRRARTMQAELPWAQQHQLALADEIGQLLNNPDAQ